MGGVMGIAVTSTAANLSISEIKSARVIGATSSPSGIALFDHSPMY
jgi:hypothetical protein